MSEPLSEDLGRAVADPTIAWERFRGATALVTGATGTIGGQIVRTLCAANAAHGLGLTVVAQGRDAAKGSGLATDLAVRFVATDVRELTPAVTGLTEAGFIFHAAAVTASAAILSRPEEVLDVTVGGTECVLELARRLGTGGVVNVSSMEVYGQGLTGVVSERELGSLDLEDPRSSYPEGKRLAEARCAADANRFGLPVVSARLGLTFGAGVPDDPANSRVPLQFARAAVAGRDIELHTDGAGVTNVCYLGDAVRALLLLVTEGDAGEAYNVVNPEASMTIREMAEVVARDVAGGRIAVVVKPPEDLRSRGYAPASIHRLSADKLQALGWTPRYGMADMYRRMIAGWEAAA